jgi:hypothetical protein
LHWHFVAWFSIQCFKYCNNREPFSVSPFFLSLYRNLWMPGTTDQVLTIPGSSSGSPTPALSAPGSGSSSPIWLVGASLAQGWFLQCTTTPTLTSRLIVRA